MRNTVGGVAIAIALFAGSDALAKTVAVTPKLSTLGVGADVSFKVNPRLGVRVMGQQFDYDASGTVDGVNYEADLNLQSFGTMLDYFPTNGRFRVSAGILANGNELNTTARLDPLESYDIGGETFTGAQLGEMDGSVTFAPAAPFAGIGWGNPFKKSRRFSFSADLGVVHQAIDETQIRSTNPFANPLIEQELENEEQRFEEEVSRLELYPVVSIGMSVLF